ncbi:hypothetical protein TRICI_005995 [Trichomonascus ciferrii]|uniref:Uncharacterized protein n=1 Tax=Trichomonascus ciferrii TaxID=44093 RepID=A0A642UMM6_9ASCO|nr:hypothetical protein TRICI_005995 [Trichomonascus ciferrii]
MSEAAISQAIVSQISDAFSNGSPGFPNIGDFIPSTLISSAVAAAATESPESNGSSGPSKATVPDSIKRNEGNPLDTVGSLLGEIIEELKPLIQQAVEEKAQKSDDQDDDKSKEAAEEVMKKILEEYGKNKTTA